MLPKINRKEQKTYYEVQGCTKQFVTKQEAIQKAVELSVGKEMTKYTYIYKVVKTRHYGDVLGFADKVIIANKCTSIAVVVSPRQSLASTGGWVDYE